VIERLLQSWRSMAPRERRMVAAAAVVVLLALAYLTLFEPAWQGRAALQKELPQLRAQLAQLRGLAAEARALSGASGSAQAPQAVRDALERSARSAGLGPNLTRLDVSGELFDLRFARVAHAQWLAWLDAAVRETRLRVADVAITREAEPGLVTVRLVLEAPRRESR
jgi:general secretion pathway protein M